MYLTRPEYITEELGFRQHFRNIELFRARSSLDLTIEQAAEQIGISPAAYRHYETMETYPDSEMQQKICDFYRQQGIFLFESDVFKYMLITPKTRERYIEEGKIPRNIVLLSSVDTKQLPAEDGIEAILREITLKDLNSNLQKILSRLSAREKKVIVLRFGLDGEGTRTLNQAGEILSVTRERIRQIENKALRKLRQPFNKKILVPFAQELLGGGYA